MRFRLTAVLGAAALLLAACAGTSSGGQHDGGDESVHTVRGVLGGPVENVPDDPDRVVSLWNTGSQLVELGITPVSVPTDELSPERLTPEQWEEVRDTPTVGTFDDVDIEKVASLEPDLVVGLSNGFMTDKDLEPYRELDIPVLIWEIDEPPDVWSNYPKLAEALGRSTDFEERDAELDRELARLEKDFDDTIAGTTWANARGSTNTGQYTVDTDQSLMYERMHAAGVVFPDALSDLGEDARYAEERSFERIPELSEADALVYETTPDNDPADATEPLLGHPLWKQLPAVQAGNAFPLRQQFNYTFAGAEQQVDDLRTAFEQYTPED